MADKMFNRKFWGIVAYLYVFCVLLALLEIQIEGPDGWASGNPNVWMPGEGWWTPVWEAAMGGKKPLTGYHLILNVWLILIFHWHFVFGKVPWSWREEARAWTRFMLVGAMWDFFWFLFNPAYGLHRFDPEHVFWHKEWIGRLGNLMPAQYLGALIATTAIVFIVNGVAHIVTTKRNIVGEWNRDVARLAWHGRWVVTNELKLLWGTIVAFGVLTVVTIMIAATVVPYRP